MQSQLVNSRNYSKSMDRLQHIFDSIAKDGFSDVVLQEIKNYTKDIQNGTEDFPRSAREVRLSLGRPSSHATRQQALQQVEMLKAAKEAQQTGK